MDLELGWIGFGMTLEIFVCCFVGWILCLDWIVLYHCVLYFLDISMGREEVRESLTM